MQFACFSDTHGANPPIDLEDMPGDYLLHAGDLYDRLSKGMTPTSTSEFRKWGTSRKKLFITRGNHDVLDPDGIFGSFDASGQVAEITPGLYLVGIGWHGKRFHELPRESDLKPLCRSIFRKAILQIPNGAHSIMLTHYPAHLPELFPFDGNPEGWAFECIAQAIQTFRPLAVVQGHLHELFGKTRMLNGTLIAFPGPYGGILDVDVRNGTASFEGTR